MVLHNSLSFAVLIISFSLIFIQCLRLEMKVNLCLPLALFPSIFQVIATSSSSSFLKTCPKSVVSRRSNNKTSCLFYHTIFSHPFSRLVLSMMTAMITLHNTSMHHQRVRLIRMESHSQISLRCSVPKTPTTLVFRSSIFLNRKHNSDILRERKIIYTNRQFVRNMNLRGRKII